MSELHLRNFAIGRIDDLPEIGFGKPEHPGDDVRREERDCGIVVRRGVVVVLTRKRDLVLSRSEFLLQMQEILIRLELRIGFDLDHQPAQNAGQLGFSGDLFAGSGRRKRVGTGLRDLLKDGTLVTGISLDRLDEIRDQVVALFQCHTDAALALFDTVAFGDEVIVYGKLTNHNGKYEIDTGNKIYSLNGKTEIEPTVDISNTPETAYTVAKANELIAAGEGLETEVYVQGIITSVEEVSTQFGNATYYINDTENTEGQLYVFRGYYLNGDKFTSEDQIKAGDKVIVYGKLMNYNGTYEIGTGNRIYSINNITTGINNVETDTKDANAPVYNLSGQRVNDSYKGIVIKNGKKYINR